MNKNKNSKVVLILSVLLLFLLVVGSASAADNTDTVSNETVLASTQTDVNTVQTVDEVVSAADTDVVGSDDTSNIDSNLLKSADNIILTSGDDGSFTSFKNKLENAGNNSIIKLENDYTWVDSDPTYIIKIKNSYDITIDGNNFTLYGSGKDFAIEFSNCTNIILKNINFINFTSFEKIFENNLGVLRFSTSTHCNVSYCTFTNIRALSNTVRSSWGSSISIYYDTSLYPNSKYPDYFCEYITIQHCNFTNSSANAGGAIYTTGHNNGAVGKVRYLCIDNCIFEKCMALSSRGSGIELNAPYTNITNCKFIDNNAFRCGAIGVFSTGHHTLIENCNFTGNTAGSLAGAISSEQAGCHNLTVKNCIFENNSAGTGGAIYINGRDSEIYNCTFIDCNATDGGAIYYNARDCTLDNCSFINNTATGDGGAVYYSGSYCSLSNSILINNNATVSGGAIYFSGSSCNLTDCILEFNTATGSGGAVEFTGTGCNITGCNFTNNTAGTHGGGVQFNGLNSQMWYCNYNNNTCYGDGGALCSNAQGSTVAYCNFTNNTAPMGNDFYAHGTNTIKFIGLKFNVLYLTNENAAYTVTDGYGTNAERAAAWRNDTDYASGFLGEFLDTSGGHATIYLVGTITSLPEKILNIPNLNIVGYDPVNNPTAATIDMNGWNHRAFTINADNIVISDLIFKNSNITLNTTDCTGGVIRVLGESGLVDNCTFINNSAVNGSAISMEGSMAFTIRDSTFTGNVASGNGTVYFYNNARSTCIYNSTFTNNKAYLGAAIFYTGNIHYYIDRITRFSGNTVTHTGTPGVDYNLSADIFTGFKTDKHQASPCVDVVYVALSGMKDYVDHNGTRDDPADLALAFHMVAPNGRVYLINASETWNMWDLYHDYYGFMGVDTFVKSNVTFYGNNTTVSQVMIIVDKLATNCRMYGFNFVNCNQTALVWNAADGEIINCTFKDNGNTSSVGGALVVGGDNLRIHNASFINNTGSVGSALYVDAKSLTLEDAVFANNTATSSGCHIYISDNGNLTSVTKSSFTKGSKTGVYVDATGVMFSDCNFTSNTGTNGAGMYINASDVSLVNCNFTANNATNSGGGIYLTANADNTNIEYCNFTDDNASSDGGAIYSLSPMLSISYTSFDINNCYSSSGAGIYCNDSSTFVNLLNCTFNKNNAKYGSALLAHNSTITNCNFTENNAFQGGAIYIRGSYNTEIHNSNFNNNATDKSGAIFIWQRDVSSIPIALINKCNFTKNHASNGGGAIYISGDNVTITNSKFTGNNATKFGGAIYVEGNSATVTGCEFKENEALDGSAIYIKNTVTDAIITDCTFTDNVAAEHGNVYLKGITSPLGLSNNVFSENSPVGASENYYDNPVFTNATVMYVSQSGTGSGLTYDDPTTWSDALAHLDNHGKIVLVSDIAIDAQTFNTQNITITSYGDGIRRKLSSNGEYMFTIPTM